MDPAGDRLGCAGPELQEEGDIPWGKEWQNLDTSNGAGGSSVEDTNDGSVTDRNSQDLQHLDSIHGPMADWPTWELLRLEVSPCIPLASPREMDMLMETALLISNRLLQRQSDPKINDSSLSGVGGKVASKTNWKPGLMLHQAEMKVESSARLTKTCYRREGIGK